MRPQRSNAVVAVTLIGVVVGMGGLAFASVPLYRLFCAVTGFGGTPSIGSAAAPGAISRMITVRFDANTNPGLPWEFQPAQRQVAVPLGEQGLAFYTARNLANMPVTGTAVYNVTPDKVGRYFHKVACFCFNEQTLVPGQQMEFPVSFWVDPKLADDPNTADVTTITLSYTFYRTLEDAARAGALDRAGPHVGAQSSVSRPRAP